MSASPMQGGHNKVRVIKALARLTYWYMDYQVVWVSSANCLMLLTKTCNTNSNPNPKPTHLTHPTKPYRSQ